MQMIPKVLSMTGETFSITEGATELFGLGTLALDFIMGHKLLATLFIGSLVGLAFSIVRKGKRTAKA